MKTKLPEKITNVDEAKEFLTALHSNGEQFHPEDDANDIINSRNDHLFTKEEGDKLNKLTEQIYALPGVPDEWDPCDHYLKLFGHTYEK